MSLPESIRNAERSRFDHKLQPIDVFVDAYNREFNKLRAKLLWLINQSPEGYGLTAVKPDNLRTWAVSVNVLTKIRGLNATRRTDTLNSILVYSDDDNWYITNDKNVPILEVRNDLFKFEPTSDRQVLKNAPLVIIEGTEIKDTIPVRLRYVPTAENLINSPLYLPASYEGAVKDPKIRNLGYKMQIFELPDQIQFTNAASWESWREDYYKR